MMTLMVLALVSVAVGFLIGDWFWRAPYRAMYRMFTHYNQGIVNVTAPTTAELNAGVVTQEDP